MADADLKPFDKLDDTGQRKLTALDVAQIAAILVNGGRTIPDAVGTALELLDASQWGLQHLDYLKGYDHGAKLWAQAKAGRTEIREFTARLPKVLWAEDGKGGHHPLAFEEALALLLPRLKRIDRMPRFRGWLASHKRCTVTEAGEMIGSLKRTGIDRRLFEACALTLGEWWKNQLSHKRSSSGRTRRKSAPNHRG